MQNYYNNLESKLTISPQYTKLIENLYSFFLSYNHF